jgi:hypothetical protein
MIGLSFLLEALWYMSLQIGASLQQPTGMLKNDAETNSKHPVQNPILNVDQVPSTLL